MAARHPYFQQGMMPGSPALQGYSTGGGWHDPSAMRPEFVQNQTMTMPGVYGQAPPGFWNSPEIGLTFQSEAENAGLYAAVYSWPGEGDVFYRAIWESPVFDVMPQLGPTPNDPNAMQLWVPGSQLVVQLRGISNLSSASGLQVGYIEYTSPMDAARVRPTTLKTDITPAALNVPGNGDEASTTLVFAPGGGTRFWKIALVFDYFRSTRPTSSALRLSAAAVGT